MISDNSIGKMFGMKQIARVLVVGKFGPRQKAYTNLLLEEPEIPILNQSEPQATTEGDKLDTDEIDIDD